MAKRKEAKELERAAAQGRLSRKGKVAIRCQICGAIGHNRRFRVITPTSDANPSNPNSKGSKNGQPSASIKIATGS
ncbi:hypothetical protein GH714_012545 [Hevea brasiliensis]|uniref:Uncharacterized protein n=1 Tax=Hevea brasiliensis TaxID=3981 RepID=A0A6A6NAB9_HEVBR|nr:hypothetical protein GH714_012545 [Hevea brasiliensis]